MVPGYTFDFQNCNRKNHRMMKQIISNSLSGASSDTKSHCYIIIIIIIIIIMSEKSKENGRTVIIMSVNFVFGSIPSVSHSPLM